MAVPLVFTAFSGIQLGHGDYDMLFGHYRTLMTKDAAEKIFSLTSDVVPKAM